MAHGVSETFCNILQCVKITINRTLRIVKLPFSQKKDFPFPEFQKREVLFLFLVNRTPSGIHPGIHRMSSDHLAKLKRRECR